MGATPQQLAWAADKLGFEVIAEDGVIIHADGSEEIVTYLVPDTKKPVKDQTAPADKTP